MAKILIVDDDEHLLDALKRCLSKARPKWQLEFAANGTDAMAKLTEDNFDVLLTDIEMQEMTGATLLLECSIASPSTMRVDGLELLRLMREMSPNTIRIMLTGNADQQTAIDAINQGSIFRFYSKPCQHQQLGDGIDAALRQYELEKSEHELLEKTLAGSVKVLVDVLSISDPISFGHTERVRNWAETVANKLEIRQSWKLKMAATLAQLGNIAIPPAIMDKLTNDEELSAIEQEIVDASPAIARDLISNIPRLAPVAEIVALQKRGFDGTGFPEDGPVGAELPLEARILRILVDLDRHTRSTVSIATAFELLKSSAAAYDLVLLNNIREVLISEVSPQDACLAKDMNLPVSLLRPGDILLTDLKMINGRLILSADNAITTAHLHKLRAMEKMEKFEEPVRILRT